jgi:hypothetical protein
LEPGVDVADAIVEQREVAFTGTMPRRRGDALAEPVSVTGWHHQVAVPLPHEDVDGDALRVESPWREEGVVVVDPSLDSRAESPRSSRPG